MAHYIEKFRLSQAETGGFSLYDKELARNAQVNNLSLINNELHKQANVVYEIGPCKKLHNAKLIRAPHINPIQNKKSLQNSRLFMNAYLEITGAYDQLLQNIYVHRQPVVHPLGDQPIPLRSPCPSLPDRDCVYV